MSIRKDRRRRTATVDTLEVAVFVGENVSLATVRVNGATGLGEAKRNPGDVWSDKVGRDLAVGRALKDASEQLLERHLAEAWVYATVVNGRVMDALNNLDTQDGERTQ